MTSSHPVAFKFYIEDFQRPFLALWLVLGLLFLVGSPTFAGGSSDGGGKGIECLENGKSIVYLADTFPLRHTDLYQNLKLDDTAGVINAMSEVVEKIYPEKKYSHPFLADQKVSLAWLLVYEHSFLKFEYAGNLPDVPDDHIDIADLPKNCRKVQVAVQNIATGVVRKDISLIFKMNFLDRGLLELHETLLRIRKQPGMDTTPIRREVESVMAAIADPRHSVEELIRHLLGPGMVRPHRKFSAASDSLYRDCQSYLISETPQEKDTPAVRHCREISRQVRIEEEEYDARTALKVFVAWPTSMLCHTKAYQGDGTVLQKFEVLRRGEATAPRTNDSYLIRFANGKSISSSSSTFESRPFDRGNEAGSIGIFSFKAKFKLAKNRDTWLVFDKYYSRTNILKGWWRDHVILCYAPGAKVGDDPAQGRR